MIPLKVSAKNYGPYPSVEWVIPHGLTAIIGNNQVGDGADSNGSGKTKLVELIPICLFGPTLPWSEYLTVGSEETVCTVALEFQQGDDTYRVRRTYDAKGRGKTTLDLEVLSAEGEANAGSGPGLASGSRGLTRPEGVEEPGPLPSALSTWKPLTRSDQKETQALVEQTIGLTEATFAHSVFAAQGARHFADPSLPPRERKAILAEALNLGIWDDLLALVKADTADITRELDAIEARLGAFEGDLAEQPALEAAHAELEAQAQLTTGAVEDVVAREQEARGKHELLKQASVSHAALIANRNAASSAFAVFTVAVAEAQQATEQQHTVAAEVAALEPVAAQVEALEAEAAVLASAAQALAHATQTRDSLASQSRTAESRAKLILADEVSYREKADQLAAQREKVMSGELPCDKCGQALHDDALTTAVASIDRDIATLTTHADKLAQEAVEAKAEARRLDAAAVGVVVPEVLTEIELEAKREALRSARAAVTTLAGLRERVVHLEAAAAKVDGEGFKAEHEDAQAALAIATDLLAASPNYDADMLAAAGRELERASTDVTVARTTDSQIRGQLAASVERIRNLASLAERSQEAVLARVGLQGRLDVLRDLGRSYGRDGIPALILESSAIPQLESEANRVLEQLDARMRFELVTQRENKGGGLRDTLDVVVHGERGSLRYESYSGGEQTRLAFALRIALARLVAARSGGGAGVLALDELTYLDATGIGKVVEVLRGLTEFRSVILISHDERMLDSFDHAVVVVRDESGSRLELSA